jgi:hypothetical protein
MMTPEKLEGIDIDISYTEGQSVAFLTPRTTRGQFFLSDNVKGQRLNNSAMTESVEQLLALIALMSKQGIAANWQSDGAPPVKPAVKICSICHKPLSLENCRHEFNVKHGNNAQPINDGRCCDDCDENVVIPIRILRI